MNIYKIMSDVFFDTNVAYYDFSSRLFLCSFICFMTNFCIAEITFQKKETGQSVILAPVLEGGRISGFGCFAFNSSNNVMKVVPFRTGNRVLFRNGLKTHFPSSLKEGKWLPVDGEYYRSVQYVGEPKFSSISLLPGESHFWFLDNESFSWFFRVATKMAPERSQLVWWVSLKQPPTDLLSNVVNSYPPATPNAEK